MIWYLFPDETHNNDGGHIEYVENIIYQKADSHLCSSLNMILNNKRSVSALEKAELLPNDTVYFSNRLDFHLKHPTQNHTDKNKRESLRLEWLQLATQHVSICSALFLDPDNGLEVGSCSKLSQVKSGKYAFYKELQELWGGKSVCVIYHHLNRHKDHGTHTDQIQERVSKLRSHVNPSGQIFALRFRPYSPRAYFILTDSQEQDSMRKKLADFQQSPYGVHWDSYREG